LHCGSNARFFPIEHCRELVAKEEAIVWHKVPMNHHLWNLGRVEVTYPLIFLQNRLYFAESEMTFCNFKSFWKICFFQPTFFDRQCLCRQGMKSRQSGAKNGVDFLGWVWCGA
jgi:hypothetical protein